MGFIKCISSLFCFLTMNLNCASSSLLSSPVREYQNILDFEDHRLDLSISSVSSCNVSCALDGSNAVFSWNHTSSDEFTIVKSNLCPNHIFQNSVGDNPNDACVQDDVQFYLPKQPYFISNSSGTNDAILTTMNPIGFTLSGVALYGPAINSYGGDAVKHEIDTFDWCGGHADPDGIEHYHSEPYCVAEAARQHPEDGMVNPGNNHSVMYGWISDGFPIYGPYGDGGVVPTDLDECQGHYGDSGAGGGYHYHYAGPTGAYQYDSYNGSGYPYFLACFKGCISSKTENSESIAQDDPYPVCKSSGTKAPAGNYSGQFFSTFTGLNYSFVQEEFVYADTDAPTASPTSAPTPSCDMYVTTTDSGSDGWNGYIFALFRSNDHSMSSPLQNITLSSGSSGATCLDVDADTCYKFAKYISGSRGLEIGWDICGYSGTVGSYLTFCTDSDGLYGNCTARATSAATTVSSNLSPTASPTVSPTSLSPTVSPTSAFSTGTTLAPTPTQAPTVSPTTLSPTMSPTTGPLSPTASPTNLPAGSPTVSVTLSPSTGMPTSYENGFDEDGCTWDKCTDTGNDCYASEEWGEPQTCDDGLLPVPQYDVDQSSYKCCGVDYAGCVDDKCTSLGDDCFANEEEWGEPQTCDDRLLPVTTWWSEDEYRCCGVLGDDFSNGCTSDDDCNSSQSCICKERRLGSRKSKKQSSKKRSSKKTVGDRSLLFGKYDECFCV